VNSLLLMVVFKCLMVWISVCRNMTTSFILPFNYLMLNFDNGQWQPYQNEEPSYGNMRHFANIEEPPRYNPYQRGRGLGRGQRGFE
jgi:hypothetical protein